MDQVVTLVLLVLLQAVLGFDNLLYISLESKRAPVADRARVRRLGIGIAVGLRIVLLIVLVSLIQAFQADLFSVNTSVFKGTFNGHSLIVITGGVFILYTSVKEIFHMLSFEEAHDEDKKSASVAKVITWIVLMNLVFSFDSILSAIALAGEDNLGIMATAIVAGGVMMILLADRVSNFLEQNRMYEVLGLFVLFIVGIMLLSEGGHLAHMALLGHEIQEMGKGTFYFVIIVLVLTDVVQSRYQRKLIRKKMARTSAGSSRDS